MTFEEILVEEGVLIEPSVKLMNNLQLTRDYYRGTVQRIVRAGERYKNQQTLDLQAKILHYRRNLPEWELAKYDEWFGVTTERSGKL